MARAQRVVSHCLMVNTATRPPCNVQNSCDAIVGFTEQMCGNFRPAPAFCRENATQPGLADAELVARYGATVAGNQRDAASARERFKTQRAKIEPLATSQKNAAAAIKKGQADFAAKLRRARATRDGYQAAIKKPGASGLSEARANSLAQFQEVTALGKSLAKDVESISKLEAQLSELVSDASTARTTVDLAALDTKQAKGIIDTLVAQLGRAATKLQNEALAKEKAAAKSKAEPAIKEAAAARDASNDAAKALAKAKEASERVASSNKELQTEAAALKREYEALKTLAAITPNGSNARAQAFKAAQGVTKEQTKALGELSWIENVVKAAASRRRSDAPSAKREGCDLERVDFKNFSYPSVWGGDSAERYRRGKAAGPQWKDVEEGAPQVAGVKYFDLDGNKTKEAVVFIEGPPSAHSGPQNELHFFELDADCRIQQVAALAGGVFEGEMKGKSYFYSDTVLDTPEGQMGTYAVGTEKVETRFINGELQEVKRRPE